MSDDFLKKAMATNDDGEIVGGETVEATWWKPEEGDILGGKVVRGFYQGGDYGVNPVVVVEEDGTGDVYNVGCSTRMLKDQVIEKAPPEGSLIVIQYVGVFPVSSAPERKFKKFIMTVEQEPDFPYWQTAYTKYVEKQRMLADEAGFSQSAPAVKTSFGPDEAPF